MIAWLEGVISDIDDTEIIINVGGVGYLVSVGSSFIKEGGLKTGDSIQISIYTVVKEDDIRLFGFRNSLCRKLFKILLSVNGVGPKVAQAILDTLSNEELIRSVTINDFSGLVKVPGVGKKTAQRIVLDIQNKINELMIARPIIKESVDQQLGPEPVNEMERLMEDAQSALSNLGFSEKESIKTIKKHIETTTSLDEIIRKSLADLRQVH